MDKFKEWIEKHKINLKELEQQISEAQISVSKARTTFKEKMAEEAGKKSLEEWMIIYKGDIGVQATIVKFAK